MSGPADCFNTDAGELQRAGSPRGSDDLADWLAPGNVGAASAAARAVHLARSSDSGQTSPPEHRDRAETLTAGRYGCPEDDRILALLNGADVEGRAA